MGVPRPEDLVEKPYMRPPKSKEEQGGDAKKIPPKFIAIGAVLAVIVLAVMMMPGKKTAVATKPEAPAVAKVGEPLPANGQKEQVAPSKEAVTQIDAALASTDASIKAITQQVVSLDSDTQHLLNAAERLAQIGDQDGKKDADRQVNDLAQKRKVLEGHYNKWVAYRKELTESKTALSGVK